jgi:uncharacterized RDD family membrane protein YckC
MPIIAVDTAQNVAIHFETATIGQRLLGRAIDYAIIGIYASLLMQFFPTFMVSRGFGSEASYNLFLFLLPAFFYSFILEVLLKGRTVGKIATNTRVIRLDGGQPTIGNYAMRWMMRFFELTTLGLADIIAVAAGGKGQRIGDVAAGTTVINVNLRGKFRQSFMREMRKDYTAKFPEVMRLSDRDMQIVDEVLRHAAATKNGELLKALVRKLRDTLELHPGDPRLEGLKAEQFVRTLILDYNHFSNEEADALLARLAS